MFQTAFLGAYIIGFLPLFFRYLHELHGSKYKSMMLLLSFSFCVTAKVLSPGSAEPTGTDVTGRRCRLSFLYEGNRAWLAYFPLAFPKGENIRFWRSLRRGDVKVFRETTLAAEAFMSAARVIFRSKGVSFGLFQ